MKFSVITYAVHLFNKFADWANISPFHRAVVGTLITQGCILVFSSVISIIITRYLGASGRGISSWAMSYSVMWVNFIMLGTGVASKKYINIIPEMTNSIIVFDLLLMGIGLVIGMPIFYHFANIYPIFLQNRNIYVMSLLLVPAMCATNILSDLIVGLGKTLHYNKLLVIERGTNVGLNALVLLVGLTSPLTFMLTYFIAIICRICISATYIIPHIHRFPKWNELVLTFKTMYKLIFSAYYCNLMNYFTGTIILLTLGTTSTAKDIGYYITPGFIIGNLLMLPSTLAMYLLPQMAKERKQHGKTVTKWYLILTFIFIFMTLVAILTYVFSDFMIYFLFGKEFMQSAQCLRIMTVGMVSIGLINVGQAIISSQHKEWLIILDQTAAAICMAILVFHYRHSLNAINAAYIYSATYLFAVCVSVMTILYIYLIASKEPDATSD